MRDKEGTLDGATVGVLALAVEDVLVQVNVVNIDGTVESDRDHLRHLLGLNAAGNASTISRAETIGQGALCGVALGSTVGILIDSCRERVSVEVVPLKNFVPLTASILIGLILAVGLAVAEEFLVQALAIAARQLAVWANGLICLQNGLSLAGL